MLSAVHGGNTKMAKTKRGASVNTQVLLFVAMLAGIHGEKMVRTRRGATWCQISPDHVTSKTSPATWEEVIHVSCPTRGNVDTCIFSHAQLGHTDVKCSVSAGEEDKFCEEDKRIQFNIEEKACGFKINKPMPWDTGEWAIIDVSMSLQGSAQTQTKFIDIYTYNQSTIELIDSNGNQVDDSYVTSFNYNQNIDEWKSGKNQWEQVEIECIARGGIPPPHIHWVINGEREKNVIDENTKNGIFNVKTSTLGSYDEKNYIEDIISKLRFNVDSELLDYLSSEYTMDTNPLSEQIRFNLHCVVEQGEEGEYSSDELTTEVNIKKTYKNEDTVHQTVGLVVVILAAVVFLLIVALLCFAKLTKRWCFGDSGYQDPGDPDKKKQLECRKVTLTVCLQVGGLLILAIPMAYIYLLAADFQPFQRGFFCDDESLKHPLMPEQISLTVALVIWLLLSFAVMVSVETLLMVEAARRDKPIFNNKTPWIVVELYRHVGYFCLGAGACVVFTETAKYTVGRLRPHYLTVCDPALSDSVCKDEFGYNKYVMVNEMKDCRGLHTSFTKDNLKEARLSFLSGHSSFSFYCATFLIVYLQARLKKFPKISPAGGCTRTVYRIVKTFRPFLQFGILVLAFWVSMTRISDYFHHPADVVTGAFVGVVFASVTLLMVAGIFSKTRTLFKHLVTVNNNTKL